MPAIRLSLAFFGLPRVRKGRSLEKPQSVGDIVVTARKNRSLGGVRINLNLPYPLEQLWVVTSESALSKVAKAAQRVICRGLSKLPKGTSLALSADAQAYGGPGGYLGFSAFVDRNGATGFNVSRGWGGGLGGIVGLGVSLQATPAPGQTAINRLQTGIGLGDVGGSVSYSRSGGFSGNAGISVGPKIGYAFGSVSGVSETTAGGSICE